MYWYVTREEHLVLNEFAATLGEGIEKHALLAYHYQYYHDHFSSSLPVSDTATRFLGDSR
jgi:hypothetical protein